MDSYVGPPASLLKPLSIPNKVLLGAGPANCSPRVLHAMSLPVLGHLHPECTQLMDEVKVGLQYVFQTKNPVTLAVSASGHGGMEMAMCNLVEPGDVVLVTVAGIWGKRAADIAARYGADVRILEKNPGENFCLRILESALARHRPVLLFLVQGESSTGVYQPLQGVGPLCRRYDCLLVVDTVASLGGVSVQTDQWEIDVIYSGSQKVLGSPAGLAPISFNSRALSKIESRKTPVSVFYWDVKHLSNYWACSGEPRQYHHTISSTLVSALREGLAIIAEEGLERCTARHSACAKRLHNGLRGLGLELFVEKEDARLPTITTVRIPANLDLKALQDYAMKNYAIEIAGGLGPTAGQVFRIGLMGYNATADKVDLVLKAVREGLQHARKLQQTSKL
uniref:Alanine--glyoxylate aminotransferase n=1 Tax=Timema cristinae TaxID=61476 RepID=A0A7R9D7G3_TIMCR|nr:unnamed protein product [Timema cristinae]